MVQLFSIGESPRLFFTVIETAIFTPGPFFTDFHLFLFECFPFCVLLLDFLLNYNTGLETTHTPSLFFLQFVVPQCGGVFIQVTEGVKSKTIWETVRGLWKSSIDLLSVTATNDLKILHFPRLYQIEQCLGA